MILADFNDHCFIPIRSISSTILLLNMCWSNGKSALIGGLQNGCANNANAVALAKDELEDYDYGEEDTLNGKDEEETLNNKELETLEDYDYSIEVSILFASSKDTSMAEISKASSRYHQLHSSKKKSDKKKAQPKQQQKQQQQQLKQKSAEQQQQQQQSQ